MSKAAGKKAAKKGVNMAAETADAIVKTALALFGGDLACDPDYHGTLSFRGAPFAIPGEDQLRLIGAEMGYGNDLPAPQRLRRTQDCGGAVTAEMLCRRRRGRSVYIPLRAVPVTGSIWRCR